MIFIRLSIQQDLDRNHERVRGIMVGMDSVEKELETRDKNLSQLQVSEGRTQREKLIPDFRFLLGRI